MCAHLLHTLGRAHRECAILKHFLSVRKTQTHYFLLLQALHSWHPGNSTGPTLALGHFLMLCQLWRQSFSFHTKYDFLHGNSAYFLTEQCRHSPGTHCATEVQGNTLSIPVVGWNWQKAWAQCNTHSTVIYQPRAVFPEKIAAQF